MSGIRTSRSGAEADVARGHPQGQEGVHFRGQVSIPGKLAWRPWSSLSVIRVVRPPDPWLIL